MSLVKAKDKKERDEFTGLFAKRLKDAREQKKLSQEKLADRAGLNLAYVGHLERGIYSPSLYTVWKLSKALRLDLSQLLKNFP